MSSVGSWRDVEEASWESMTSLGHQWMVKSTASNQGYMVMLTDGCALWGEKRSRKYVFDQADEWASCIEAGITDLCMLVLSEMKKKASAAWGDDRKDVTLCISSKLNDMSYSWEFQLTRLSDELFNHHWATPMMVQFHHLESRIKQLSKELESKNRQLEELLPDNAKSKKSSKKKTTSIESSVGAVLTLGTWSVLQEQILQYPEIMKNLHNTRNPESKNDGQPKGQSNTLNKDQTEQVVEMKSEAELEEEELQRQRERRAKIQEMIHGTATQTTPQKKKKKKLNI